MRDKHQQNSYTNCVKSAAAVLDRLSSALGAENDTQLSKVIGEKRSTVGNWRNRNLPTGAIIEIAKRHGLSLDYLFYGASKQNLAPLIADSKRALQDETAGHKAIAASNSPLVSESDLSLPAMRFLAEAPDGFLTTADLIARLEALFKPTGLDAEIGSSRADTRFSQKVRNIISHRDRATNSVRKGWIDYDDTARGLRITKAGRAVLESFGFGPGDVSD